MIGNRIKQARKALGLSQRDLASKISVSAMAISKYENNSSVPSSKVLIELAGALNVRSEYFFRPQTVELEGVEYRKHVKLEKKILDQIEGDIIEQIERFIELEELLPSSPIKKFEVPKDIRPKIDSYESIEDIADKVRQSWGLGHNPIADLIDALEEQGVKVFQSQALHDEKFDGFAGTVNDIPIIVVGRDWPGDRQRFTLAHELGHLILKDRLPQEFDEEKAANRFAGAFLAPASEVFKELGENRKWLEPRELYELKHTYGLSMQAWIFRATDLNIFKKPMSGKLWGFFKKKGWIKEEPGKAYPPEEPKLFWQLVFHAYGEEIINETKSAELLRLSLDEFRCIRNMENCERYNTNK